MILLSDYLKEGVTQTISSHRNIDKTMGSNNIRDRHRQRLARLEGRIRLLKKKYSFCRDLNCKITISGQIKRWRAKYAQEMFKKPNSKTLKTY